MPLPFIAAAVVAVVSAAGTATAGVAAAAATAGAAAAATAATVGTAAAATAATVGTAAAATAATVGTTAAATAATVGAVATSTAGAVITGAATAGVAKAVLDNHVNKVREQGRQQGREEAKAEYAVQVTKVKMQLKAAQRELSKYREFEEYTTALIAVATAAANSDGPMSTDQMQHIREFAVGESYIALPDPTKRVIESFFSNPPSFNDALHYANNVSDKSVWKNFGDMVELVISLKGYVTERERAFQEAWRQVAS